MYTVKEERLRTQEGTLVEVMADTIAEITPPKDNWLHGSVAYDITDRKFYLLNGEREWISSDQEGG